MAGYLHPVGQVVKELGIPVNSEPADYREFTLRC